VVRERDKNVASVEEMSAQLDAAAAAHERVEGERNELEQKVAELRSAVAAAESRVDERERECAEKAAKIGELESSLSEARARADEMNGRLEELTASVEVQIKKDRQTVCFSFLFPLSFDVALNLTKWFNQPYSRTLICVYVFNTIQIKELKGELHKYRELIASANSQSKSAAQAMVGVASSLTTKGELFLLDLFSLIRNTFGHHHHLNTHSNKNQQQQQRA